MEQSSYESLSVRDGRYNHICRIPINVRGGNIQRMINVTKYDISEPHRTIYNQMEMHIQC